MNGTDFFTPISNTKPYLKMAFEGFAGSGKTFTAGNVAIGLHKRIGSKKPIAIFDTERAAKFLKPLFAKAGIEAGVKESRSLTDLLAAMKLCKEGYADILVIDSITHVWENVLAAFMEEKKRTNGRLEFQDWGILKPRWKRDFSDPFVNNPTHYIMCGRAGFEYETIVTEGDDGKKRKEILKSGIKMKVEGETAYEPDLLVLMELCKGDVIGEKTVSWREATVLKDRGNVIDGQTFKNPTYDTFAPTIEVMLASPDKMPIAVQGNDTLLFKSPEDNGTDKRERDKMLEEIEGVITSAWPGQSAAEKKNKVDILDFAFNTRSWKAITEMNLNVLAEGYKKIIDKLVSEGLVERKVLMPTQQQRDRFSDLLKKAMIFGPERIDLEKQFEEIKSRDEYEDELEKLNADFATRRGKKEPDTNGVLREGEKPNGMTASEAIESAKSASA